MKTLYCIKYGNPIKPYCGYIKPWNGVRDEETWSLTYCTPSMIDGIAKRLVLNNNICRHKLTFDLNGMHLEQNRRMVYDKDKDARTIHKRHCLVHPELTLAFETREDAELALTQTILFGQNVYILYPVSKIIECTESEFDLFYGVETFLCEETEPNSIYCGNNRLRNNERMYIKIHRNDWRYQD